MEENKFSSERKYTIKEKSRDFSSLANFSKQKKFTITKKIAKHGKQVIIVIPKVLEEHLKPGTIAEISINVLNDDIVLGDVKNDK